MSKPDPDNLHTRLREMQKRIQQLADLEANAARVGGENADGRHWPEKKRLIDASDEILIELLELYGESAK